MATEKRLIDANAIKYTEYRSGGGRDYPVGIVTEYEIARMPTVDAVEVVRCKDCFADGCCSVQIDLGMGGEGYCPKGKRRSNHGWKIR